jgi:Glycosyltransferase
MNIIAALRERGCGVVALDATPTLIARRLMKIASLLRGTGTEYGRTVLQPIYTQIRLHRLEYAAHGAFLHISSATVPQIRRKGGPKHGLYLDSTFHILAKYQPLPISDRMKRRYDEFERDSLRAADKIFTTSDHIRADIIDYYGIPAQKVTRAGSGTGNIAPANGVRSYDSYTVLFVARSRFEEKGGALLLDAFRKARALQPMLKLVMVADEMHRARAAAEPGVCFHSALSWEELQRQFNTCDLFAMPAFYEPYGLVYLEALKCRTPILGLNRNAIPEFTQNGRNGFVVDEPTPEAVAAALLDAFTNPDRLAAMGENGQSFVHKHYGWDKVASTICGALL